MAFREFMTVGSRPGDDPEPITLSSAVVLTAAKTSGGRAWVVLRDGTAYALACPYEEFRDWLVGLSA